MQLFGASQGNGNWVGSVQQICPRAPQVVHVFTAHVFPAAQTLLAQHA